MGVCFQAAVSTHAARCADLHLSDLGIYTIFVRAMMTISHSVATEWASWVRTNKYCFYSDLVLVPATQYSHDAASAISRHVWCCATAGPDVLVWTQQVSFVLHFCGQQQHTPPCVTALSKFLHGRVSVRMVTRICVTPSSDSCVMYDILHCATPCLTPFIFLAFPVEIEIHLLHPRIPPLYSAQEHGVKRQ